jgi:hypothetical protein
MPTTDKRLRLLFYTAWLVLLLVQCALVGLSGDEAYYWRYSRELAWGYFDHPPLTAALVKAGYLILNNELGVRLFFALLVTGFIYAMEKLVNPGNLRLFYAVVLSVAFLQIGMVWGGGMMALPDFPLLFFEALFFLLYRRYLENPSWLVNASLAGVASLMLLTKYHGILVIGFVVLSNPRLLLRPSFWMICGGSVALLIPHIMWQITNDFPSIRYHLFERSANAYTIKYTFEYLGALPFITGPLIGFVLIYCSVVRQAKDPLERAMKFVLFGTYLFFFLMTFKGRVEGNWTIITLVPLLYLGYKTIEHSTRLIRVSQVCFVISLALIMIVRIIITTHIPVPLSGFSEQLTPWTWCSDLKQRTGGRPAVFINSYQRAALYEFYEGIRSYSLNNFWGRKNQYTIWDTEAGFQGQSVALISNWEMANLDTLKIDGEYYPYLTIDNFRATSNLLITSDLDEVVRALPAEKLTTHVQFKFSTSTSRDLEANPEYPTTLVYGFFQGTTPVEIGATEIVIKNRMIGAGSYPVTVVAPANPGRYFLHLAAGTGWLPPGINSQAVEFVVEQRDN